MISKKSRSLLKVKQNNNNCIGVIDLYLIQQCKDTKIQMTSTGIHVHITGFNLLRDAGLGTKDILDHHS